MPRLLKKEISFREFLMKLELPKATAKQNENTSIQGDKRLSPVPEQF